MRTIRRTGPAALFAAILLLAAGPAAASEAIERFLGSYVGSGQATVLETDEKQIRDLDVTIERFEDDGFTIKWITVVRGENGARTGEDVKRREVEESFVPIEDKDNVFILAPEGGLFQRSELPNPLRGEAVRWAALEDGGMTIYSLAIRGNGKSELQVYRRTLTEKGMDISFIRLEDESVQVRMQGTLVRTE